MADKDNKGGSVTSILAAMGLVTLAATTPGCFFLGVGNPAPVPFDAGPGDAGEVEEDAGPGIETPPSDLEGIESVDPTPEVPEYTVE